MRLVWKDDPLKQGLRPFWDIFNPYVIYFVWKDDPLKQGLRLLVTPFLCAPGIMSEKTIHQNKDS